MLGANSFICIMHRESDPERSLNLQATLKYYHERLPELEIFLIEEDTQTRIKEIPPWVRYYLAYNPGSFSQGWAVNIAAKLSTRKVGASVTNDAILKWSTYISAEKIVGQYGNTCYIPYYLFYDLNISQTYKFRTDFKFDFDDNILARRYASPIPGPGAEKAGGIIFFNRLNYLGIGGFDEDYRGYGAEDDSQAFRCKMLGTFETCHNPEMNLYHLYHPIGGGHSRNTKEYQNNYALYSKIRSYNPEQIREYTKELSKRDFGNLEKYRNEK